MQPREQDISEETGDYQSEELSPEKQKFESLTSKSKELIHPILGVFQKKFEEDISKHEEFQMDEAVIAGKNYSVVDECIREGTLGLYRNTGHLSEEGLPLFETITIDVTGEFDYEINVGTKKSDMQHLRKSAVKCFPGVKDMSEDIYTITNPELGLKKIKKILEAINNNDIEITIGPKEE